jgi:hypothetical protein
MCFVASRDGGAAFGWNKRFRMNSGPVSKMKAIYRNKKSGGGGKFRIEKDKDTDSHGQDEHKGEFQISRFENRARLR